MVEIVWKENIENECDIDLLNKLKYINNKSTNLAEKEKYIKDLLNNYIITDTDINIIKYYYWKTRLPMEYLIEYTEFKNIDEIEDIILPNDYLQYNYKCRKCQIEDIKYFPEYREDMINNFTKYNKLYKDDANKFMKYLKHSIDTIKRFGFMLASIEQKINDNDEEYNKKDNKEKALKLINKFKKSIASYKEEIELYKENGSASVCKKCINEYLEEERMSEKRFEDFIKRETNYNPSFNIDEYFYLRNIPYSEYLQTEHWKNIREGALLRANHMCRMCGSKYNLQVHHNTYNNLGNERNEDLTVLCKECHEFFHDR